MIGEIKAGTADGKKVAVVGAGPAGIASAYFLARAGASVTVFEKEEKAGGVIRYVIPGFRISDDAIDKDVSFIQKMGVEIKTGTEVKSVQELKAQGYDAVIVATGANKPGTLKLEKGETINALKFLRDFKATGGKVALGKNVVVIGGGNVAIDVARDSKRCGSDMVKVNMFCLESRETMPASVEEIEEVQEDEEIPETENQDDSEDNSEDEDEDDFEEEDGFDEDDFDEDGFADEFLEEEKKPYHDILYLYGLQHGRMSDTDRRSAASHGIYEGSTVFLESASVTGSAL